MNLTTKTSTRRRPDEPPVVIIADDLTGANDSGAQLALAGLSTSVLFGYEREAGIDREAIVLNTDSRSLEPKEAYRKAREAVEFAKSLGCRTLYKKLDSTLRGNIGAELDAVIDAFAPDFVVLAPAFPDNGRTTRHGVHCVHGVPVHETEAARDPKTPVASSYIPELLAGQTAKPVARIDVADAEAGREAIAARMEEAQRAGARIVVCDAETNRHLAELAAAASSIPFRVAWAGSAGLARFLPIGGANPSPPSAGREIKDGRGADVSSLERSAVGARSALIVSGSASARTAVQRETLESAMEGRLARCELRAEKLLSDSERSEEIRRAEEAGVEAARDGRHYLLTVSSGAADVSRAQDAGRRVGLSAAETSDRIAAALGEAAARLLERARWAGVVLTGGDTAMHACSRIGALRLDLIAEVEVGVPIGRLRGPIEVAAVTKAGNFGTNDVLTKAVEALERLGEV